MIATSTQWKKGNVAGGAPVGPRSMSYIESEILVNVQAVSKKFCRSLSKSLWYGVKDIAHELKPSALGCWHAQDGEQRCASSIALRDAEFWAVKEVGFQLRRGECLGLIGHNGAGKTTLLKMLNGLIKPDEGRIEMRGAVGAVIALGAGFNPILTGRENILVNAAVLGLGARQIAEKTEEIISFAELEEFIDSPVQSYSSGMQVRLGFAIATALKPDILILDEVLAVGDVAFRAKCFRRIGEISKDSAVIFVSHEESQVARICDKVLVLDHGKLAFLGDAMPGLDYYRDMGFSRGITQQAIELGEGVISCRTASESRAVEVRSGAALELAFEVTVDREVPIGLALVNVVGSDGVVVAQLEFTEQCRKLVRGRNLIRLAVGRVDLARGRYIYKLALFGETRRETVVQHTRCGTIAVEGPLGYWCNYRMPLAGCVVELVH